MSESRALMTEADKLAAAADAVSSSYATELARVLRDLERELRTLAMDALGGSTTALSKAIRAGKMRAQIQDALNAAGYTRLVTAATSSGLDTLLAQVQRLRGAANLVAFSTSDFTRILALKELAKMDLLGQGDEMAHAIWRTFAQGLYSQRPVTDLLDDLSEAMDTELTQAGTLYDTTVNVFARQVEAMKSQPDDVFAYMGPADAKTRPFCVERVGKVFTQDEINAMDNGQLPNCFLTGGGYNCRHQWIAVSKVSELRKLVGTDERMPEVASQLEQVAA